MKRYWSLIDSPFQKFAAWVDEEGREQLWRFYELAHRANRVRNELQQAPKQPEF